MPTTVTTGLSQKIGTANYGTLAFLFGGSIYTGDVRLPKGSIRRIIYAPHHQMDSVIWVGWPPRKRLYAGCTCDGKCKGSILCSS